MYDRRLDDLKSAVLLEEVPHSSKNFQKCTLTASLEKGEMVYIRMKYTYVYERSTPISSIGGSYRCGVDHASS
jgi:hypothetical protein